ncbi:MAG: hypothetical protein SCALA702_18320 [Melioribacteraceae bacterium]|nr:MAG: hypothetical protein SCALA702_18320 [Melioribacteraceae bacterium]
MERSPKILEKQLYDIWLKQEFCQPLTTVSGEEVVVLDTGIVTPDLSGPDFKNARIRIGNLTYVGDIEIDTNYTDWKAHGHSIDNKYNKIVLHACLHNKHEQPFVYTKEGRKVHTLDLTEHIDSNKLENIEEEVHVVEQKHSQFLKCAESVVEIDYKIKEKLLSELGFKRLDKKCKRIYARLKELAYLKEMHVKEPVVGYELTRELDEREFTHEDFQDRELWEQLFYEMVFEALGYSKNKNIMLHLAQSADISFLRKLGLDDEFTERVESALYHIGGLVPELDSYPGEEIEKYVRKIEEHWDNIRRIYDAEIYDETQWHFFKLRPQNFPTIRIAGGTRIVKEILYGNLIDVFVKKITEIRNFNVLINILRSILVVKSDGFWKHHYVFDKPANGEIKYFVGVSRADEIIINVLLPYFTIYFDVFGEEALAKKVFKLYAFFQQKSENKIVHEVAENLGVGNLTKKTLYQQGMIELFRNFCSKGRCMDCEIGKMVFD